MSVATDLPPEVVIPGRASSPRANAVDRWAVASGKAPSARTANRARISPAEPEVAIPTLGDRSPARAVRPRLALVPVGVTPMTVLTMPLMSSAAEARCRPKPASAPGLEHAPSISPESSTDVASAAAPQRSPAPIDHPTTPAPIADHLAHHFARNPAGELSHRVAHHVSPLVARSVAPPSAVQLTHRGRLVLLIGAALLAFAVVAGSWVTQRGDAQAGSVSAPSLIVVRSGDTLWAIARRVAPQRDPRAEISDLVRVNSLSVVDLTPGQILRTH